MKPGSITEADWNTYRELMQFILDHAKWKEMDTQDHLKLTKLLSFMNKFSKSIYDNICEEPKIVEPEKKPTTRRSRSKK